MSKDRSEITGPAIPVQRQPFGRAPALLAIAAADTLRDLSEVPQWSEGSRRWLQSDWFCLQNWWNIEIKTPAAQVEPRLQVDDVINLNEMLTRFNVALPFDEAERDWLFTAYDEAWGPGCIRTIRRQEATIVSSGLRQVIQGRDLMRRWWSWRRETDEYAGQGSLDLAREALRELVETYSPDQGLPETYLALLASRDQAL